MAKRKPKKKSRLSSLPPKTIGLSAAAVLVIAGLVYLGFFHKSNPNPNNGGQITTADGKKVDLSPASSTDKQAGDTNKQAIVDRDAKLNSSSMPQAAQSTLIITDATSTAAKAYITGVFEDGGNCSATATQGAQTINAASQGFENVSYTQCAPLNWQSPLGSGAWSVKVTYKSGTTDVSAVKTIQL